MYSLYAGDDAEPSVPNFRGRAERIETLKALLNNLQQHIPYDWWYILNNSTHGIVAQSDNIATWEE